MDKQNRRFYRISSGLLSLKLQLVKLFRALSFKKHHVWSLNYLMVLMYFLVPTNWKVTDVMSRPSIRYRIIIFYLYFGDKEVLGLFCHKQALGSNKDNVRVTPATIVNKKNHENDPLL